MGLCRYIRILTLVPAGCALLQARECYHDDGIREQSYFKQRVYIYVFSLRFFFFFCMQILHSMRFSVKPVAGEWASLEDKRKGTSWIDGEIGYRFVGGKMQVRRQMKLIRRMEALVHPDVSKSSSYNSPPPISSPLVQCVGILSTFCQNDDSDVCEIATLKFHLSSSMTWPTLISLVMFFFNKYHRGWDVWPTTWVISVCPHISHCVSSATVTQFSGMCVIIKKWKHIFNIVQLKIFLRHYNLNH